MVTSKLSTITRTMLTLVLVAAGLAYVAASPASAQSNPRPSTPTNVSATVGDTEATITWTAGSAVSLCDLSGFFVRIETPEREHIAVSEAIPSNVTTWTVEGLTASTEYEATVWAFSQFATCTGGPYSAAGKAKFTTNASNSGSDPAVVNSASTPQRAPRRVRNFAQTHTGTQVTFTWTAPASPRTRQCSHTGEYAIRVWDRTTKEEVTVATRADDTNHAWQGKALTATVTGLTAGAKYKAHIFASGGADCGWSGRRKLTWTQ